MMLLTLHIGEERYGLDVENIVEVVPLVELRRIPLAESYIAGVFDYRGDPVPVVDLCRVLAERPCARHMSTRIILVHYPVGDGGSRTLGLLAERVTETVKHNEDEFKSSGVRLDKAPFLGGVCSDDQGMLQWITTDSLLPPHVKQMLFQEQSSPVNAQSGTH